MKNLFAAVLLAFLFAVSGHTQSQISPPTGAEVAGLLQRTDNVLVPALQEAVEKEKGLGLDVRDETSNLEHIQKVVHLMGAQHRFNEFTLYILSSNINGAWYTLILDADKIADKNPEGAADLRAIANTVIKPVANMAAMMAYRLIYNVGTADTLFRF